MRMETDFPARKVLASSLGVALVEILIWLIRANWPNLNIPDGVETAMVVLVAFLLGYLVPPHPRDGLRMEPAG